MHRSLIVLIPVLCIVLTIQFFSCMTLPPNPYDISKTKIDIFAQSSNGIVSALIIEDSTGNNIRLGAQCNLWNYIDSIQFRQIAQTATSFKDSIVAIKSGVSLLKYSDTIWESVVFNEPGTKTIKAKAYLNNGNIISDSINIIIYAKPINNHPPKWQQDTIKLSCSVRSPISLRLLDTCSDPDNDILTFNLLPGAPSGDTILAGVYSFTPATNDTGVLLPRIAAIDPKGGADTVLLRLSVSPIATPVDTQPPSATLLSPLSDSASTNASFYTIELLCKDLSGIASANAALGASNFIGVKTSDSIWSIVVSNLTVNTYNTITITVTDNSSHVNKASDTVYIKYDPNMLDSIGPIFCKTCGPVSGDTIKDSIVVIVDSIIDPSGVDSVCWSLNGAPKKMLIPTANNTFSLKDTLKSYHLNRIIIYAQDKSIRKNKDSVVVVLDYNVPPIITDTNITTDRNIAISCTLHALSADADSLIWSTISTPSASSGSITGTLPAITFTPAANWSGADSFFVKVTDGKWSDTAKVKILVANILVAPKNVKIISQPASDTVVLENGISFSVSMNSDVNPPPTYQWERNGTVISTAASYTISTATSLDSGQYTVTVTNSEGFLKSPTVVLVVLIPPSIIAGPVSQTRWAADTVTFSITATGTAPLRYQWRKGSADIPEATSAMYKISSINYSIDNNATFSCVVSNAWGSKTSNTAMLTVDAVKMAAGGDEHSLILKTDGTLWVCGTNESGQLGTSDTISRLRPVQIMTSVQSIGCGDESSFIIRSDGSLWACGSNYGGALGLRDEINRLVPVPVTQGVVAVAAGDAHCLILKTDNTLWACGYNSNGQLGLGDQNNRLEPTYITDNVANIAAGGEHSLILKKDGTLFACGYNCFGVLGDGTTQNSYIPIQIKTNVANIAISNYHSLILMTNSMVFACGDNYYGQLGDGTTEQRHLPVQVQLLTDVVKIATGTSYSIALKTNGTLWTFGSNFAGELGDGTTTDRHLPIQVNSDVAGITNCDAHTLIVKVDGSLWGCGQNFYGQLGDGTTTDHYTWIQIKW